MRQRATLQPPALLFGGCSQVAAESEIHPTCDRRVAGMLRVSEIF